MQCKYDEWLLDNNDFLSSILFRKFQVYFDQMTKSETFYA